MKTISKTLTTLLIVFLSVTLASASRDEELKKTSEYAIELLKDTDSKLKDWFKDAYGYVIFPNVGKGGFGIGGAFGKGEVYENGKFIGEARLTQGTIGFQLGGQLYTEVIFFNKKENLSNFKESRYAFSAQMSAVAAAEGAAANAKYEHGVAVFTLARPCSKSLPEGRFSFFWFVVQA
ncbi:MAG: YSC84-related protein, partial [Verrucomicrobia bacterium]|nr:YSC84-related protein [Verrucomicrobiota bacterium]